MIGWAGAMTLLVIVIVAVVLIKRKRRSHSSDLDSIASTTDEQLAPMEEGITPVHEPTSKVIT